jgi:Zn-dependent protease
VFQAFRLLEISPVAFFVYLSALVATLLVGLSFHEFCHALVAHRLGDDTARRQGRLTMNPIAHLDVTGTLMMVFAGFGWAKPVPVNPYYLRGNPQTGMLLVALAGPLSNLAIAGIAALPFKLGLLPWQPGLLPLTLRSWQFDDYAAFFLFWLVTLNVVLGVFNLLPLAPLDGFRIALGLLPRDLAMSFAKIEPYGMVILFFVAFALPLLLGVNPLFEIIGPVINAIISLLTGQSRGAF